MATRRARKRGREEPRLTASEALAFASASASAPQALYFMSGRMNPPTLGHLQMINVMAKLANTNGAKAIVYLSSSYNYKPKKTNKKGSKVLTPIILPEIDEFGDDDIKNKKYQNPLFPEQKKYYLTTMMENASKIEGYEFLRNVSVEIEKEANGFYQAILYAKRLVERGEYSDIGYFFGIEESTEERASREAPCINIHTLNVDGSVNTSLDVTYSDKDVTKPASVNHCYTIPRIKSDTSGGRIGGKFKDESLSGSKARKIAYGIQNVYLRGREQTDFDGLKDFYTLNGVQVLSDEDIRKLIEDLRAGVNLGIVGRDGTGTVEYLGTIRNYSEMGVDRELSSDAPKGRTRKRRKRKYKTRKMGVRQRKKRRNSRKWQRNG